ncbi:dihydrolipoyl dehydrogenase [Bacteriovoracaceae bacterium]|nr:dihydrolipoyl dehydrogenase [Bacteriovoracaceae bacterium]
MEEFDAIIIGSGPGGYVCALRCAQLGMKTAIVERYKTLGGTCLNVGCIPSKAWLDSSEKFHELNHSFKDHGIDVSGVKLNFTGMRKRVENVVSDTCGGINYLMKKNKITVFEGHGRFVDAHSIAIDKEGKTNTIRGKNIVIATGSKPSSLPGITIDKKRVITSTEALYLKNLPKEMVVIGAGVIGLELASVFNRLGTKLKVFEYLDLPIATMDGDMAKGLHKVLKKEGIEFYLGHGVSGVKVNKNKVEISAKNNKSGEDVQVTADYCLVAVGRKPYTDKLDLDKAGLKVDDKGRIPVNGHLATESSHIYAIGDVVAGPMLAHKAEEEGVFVAESICGQKPHIDYNLIPGVVYTWPEVASVGKTEEELKKDGVPYKKGAFPFKASGRARASNESDGLIKVLAHKDTDEILGVHMLGPRAADMIGEAVVAMEFRASSEDIARICHAHPTYSEAFKEACLAATDNRALHI